MAQEAPKKSEAPKGEPQQINATFEDPDLNVDAFIKRFENESREVFNKREEIARAVGIEPGMSVADIGAGTGLFTRLFAEKVGAEGKVYAVDIAAAFLKHIEGQAKANGQDKIITTVLGSQNSTNLEPRCVDVVFLCDTYHHFEDANRMLRSIRRALKPQGRIILIDFDRHEGASDFIKGHVRATKEEFFKEVEAVGFERIEASPDLKLDENFFASFRKVRMPTPAEPVKEKAAAAPKGQDVPR